MSTDVSGASPTTLISEGDTGRGGLVGIVVCTLGIGLGAWLALAMPDEVGAVISGGVIIFLGLVGAYFSVRSINKARRLAPGTLATDRGYFLLGEQARIRFDRRVKRGHGQAEVSARLELIEWVEYTVGTDTRRMTRVVGEYPLETVPAGSASGVAADVLLTLPTYPPTFKAPNNTVRWKLVVDLAFPDGFTEDSVFWLPVAASYAPGVQLTP